MSNKDLIDRLQQGTAPKAVRAPSEPKAAERPTDTTRVAQGVVRRRAAAAPPEPSPPPPPPKTILRRPAARAEEPAPAPAAPTTIRRPASTSVASVTRAESVRGVTPSVRSPIAEQLRRMEAVGAPRGAPVEAPRPAEPAPPPAAGSAPSVAESPAAVEPVAPAVEPAPAPPAATAAPAEGAPAGPGPVESARPAVPRAAEAQPAPAAPAEPVVPTLERAVIVDRPGGTARLPSATRPAGAPGGRLPDAPILPGLGRAVVSLPAGYDPTDPTGARRRAREQAAQGVRWPGAPGTAPPGGLDNRDRRPDAPGESRDRDRKKGRRGEVSVSEVGAGRPRKAKPGRGQPIRPPKPQVKHKIRIEGEITVAAFAHELGVKAAEVVRLLLSMGHPATVNQTIDFETAAILAQELGHEVENVAFDESEHLIRTGDEDRSAWPNRAPVVTVMGHVDHGKTTLLDAIRKTKVAAGEAGGITQHIGAYTVDRGGRTITFLDTPGHAAFSAMRARGAKATDVVILVVAADDGIMPQTVEAISHAKAAGVPIVVAVNKCDKPGVNPARIRQALMEHGLVGEEYGGDTVMVNISALKGTGVDDLLDNVLIVAELLDLRANPDRHAQGVVLESRLETGRGAVATLLVQNGTLHQGDILVIGSTWGRVRAMSDDTGRKIKEAGPSMPVEIFGLQDIPLAGDEFVVVGSEKDARALAEHRADASRAGALSQRRQYTVEDLFKQGGEAAPIQHIVIKTDVGGSLEALRGAVEALQVPGTQVKVLHGGIGPVTESDVTLAAGNAGFIVAFNVKADAKARQAADQYNVEIRRYDVIYNVIDDIKARLLGMLAPVYEERKVGEAECRAVFTIPRIGQVAGCMVLDGKVVRGALARVSRGGKVIHEGKLASLRRFKEDVKEVEKGFECGLSIEDFSDVQVGDLIAVYQRVEVPRTA